MKTAPIARMAATLMVSTLLGTLIITTHQVMGQTAAPTATVNASALDFTTAKLYKSDSDVFEMQLPAGWTATNKIAVGGGSSFVFSDGANPQTAPALMQFQLSDAKKIYAGIDPTGKANSPQSALQSIIDAATASSATPGAPAFNFSPISDIKVGSLSGKGIVVIVPPGASGGPETHFYLQVVPVTSDQLLYILARADVSIAAQAMPLFDKMLASVVIKLANVPTATVTPTLFPLLITATALQAQVNALTITPTTVPLLMTMTAMQGQVNALTVTTTSTATPSSAASATGTPTATVTATPTTGS